MTIHLEIQRTKSEYTHGELTSEYTEAIKYTSNELSSASISMTLTALLAGIAQFAKEALPQLLDPYLLANAEGIHCCYYWLHLALIFFNNTLTLMCWS